jgi:hypothetical protein
MGLFCKQPKQGQSAVFHQAALHEYRHDPKGAVTFENPNFATILEILHNPKSAVFTHFYLVIEPYLVFVFKNLKMHLIFVFNYTKS